MPHGFLILNFEFFNPDCQFFTPPFDGTIIDYQWLNLPAPAGH